MSATLANKIAAGEVISRPAGAVKELIENAVDANATRIDVEIKASGSGQILVSDNGIGMGPQDAEQSFLRHATSKIRTAEELDQIWTLGFRGEALASIAAISQVTLKTRREGDPQGTLVRIHGGELQAVEPCAAKEGTVVDMRNIFYNTPARRKFLKSPATEFFHITDTFLSSALANPRIAYSLTHNGDRVHRFPACTGEDDLDLLRQRSERVFGSQYARDMIEVKESTTYISAYGLTCRAEKMRRSRKSRYLYVNGRIVRSTQLQHAIMSAYEGMTPARRFPAYALFLSLDPIHIDVNVHPTKTEVRFEKDRDVYRFLRAVVRKALGTADLIPQFQPGQSSALGRRHFRHSERSSLVEMAMAPVPGRRGVDSRLVNSMFPPEEPVIESPEENDEKVSPQLWQLHDNYICTRLRTGLMILDQNAAHQRILYEQALNTMSQGSSNAQQLIFAEAIELNPQDMALLEELEGHIAALGFDIERYSGRTVVVRGVPQGLRNKSERYFLRDLLEDYRSNTPRRVSHPRENLARSFARSGAIQPGTQMNSDEMRTLIDELFQCKEPYTTPSGRPVMIKISSDELKQRFTTK